jgi:putative SOS response-associated peptidase YedK
MCVKFHLEQEYEELDEIAALAQRSPLAAKFAASGKKLLTSGDVGPSDVAPVVAPGKNGKQSVFPMEWGFRLNDGKLILNARTETAAEKQLFRDPWKQRRCAVPASWYYEWKKLPAPEGGKPSNERYRFLLPDRPVWLCGLYRIQDGLPAFTVLTREPSQRLKEIHDRMPLILPAEAAREWADPRVRPEDLLGYAVTETAFERY